MTADIQTKTAARSDDTSAGLGLFVIFVMAILIVTGAVALLALVNSWWVLGAVFAVHLGVTAIVTAAIAAAVSGRMLTVSRSDGEPARTDRRPNTRSQREAAAAHL